MKRKQEKKEGNSMDNARSKKQKQTLNQEKKREQLNLLKKRNTSKYKTEIITPPEMEKKLVFCLIVFF